MDRSETRTVYCNGDARLRVENDVGQVVAMGWEHDRIELTVERHAASEADLDKIRVEFSGGPSEVLVTYTTSEALDDAWVDFKLKAPRMAALDLHNAAGEIQLSGFYGSSRASTVSGGIRAARMNGTSTLTSASGAINGAALEGTVFARSGSGPVSLHGNLAGSHRVETASGDIQVDGVDGSVNARSASGTIEIRGRLTGRCLVRTISGDIRVRLLEDSDVEVTDRGIRREPSAKRGRGSLVLDTTSGGVDLQRER